MDRSTASNTALCPVRAGASTIQRIASYTHPKPILNRPICFYISRTGASCDLSSSHAINTLRIGAAQMGSEVLGFKPEEIGTHSIRSGGAMAYYLLDKTDSTAVMFFGRWKSTAFLHYIRSQVDTFWKGHSTNIVENAHFHTVPDLDPNIVSALRWSVGDLSCSGGSPPFNDPRLTKSESSPLCLENGGRGHGLSRLD